MDEFVIEKNIEINKGIRILLFIFYRCTLLYIYYIISIFSNMQYSILLFNVEVD